ncbi:MAG TPA: hypothetical protein VE196_03245 [Pseudonocardiaceae bacterium]|nr:hypothetical protein [Pseudonocardiaceae bacterium]
MLMIANHEDEEAELVRDALTGSVVWIDTADFPERLGLITTPDRTHPGWLHYRDEVIDLGTVSAVYRRSPGVFGLDEEMSEPERRFALMEAVQGIGGAFSALPCRTWVNHPARVADASYKSLQLSIARDCNLSVPPTLITNVGAAARRFIDETGGRVIYKPMSPGVITEQGRVMVINATLVTKEMVDDASISKTAHTFQRFIEKSYDARVTVIGREMFGVAIDAKTGDTFVDWRADYDALDYRPVDVPDEVRSGIHFYMTKFGLSFAAFDFSVDHSGRWWFLEANPNGLWAWLEERTGIPVSDAIASYLSKGDSTL